MYFKEEDDSKNYGVNKMHQGEERDQGESEKDFNKAINDIQERLREEIVIINDQERKLGK